MNFKEYFEGKVILITGGTGFLGRSLVTRLLQYNPASIRIFSRDEVKHHKLKEDFNGDERLRYCIGNVRDQARLSKAMDGVDYVIHAAALKRLDLIEYNVEESIKTNIMGSLNVVNACLEKGVKKAIFVSTDKACSPVNTYGACKFVGERIFTESNFSKGHRETVFACVRYGNVLESTGSVIPLFRRKIENQEVIPLTSPEMTRFIITPEQAIELVFKAFLYSQGGEVFVPKLPAFKITDLIDVMIDASNQKSEIETIGLRPGEKIHEQMINSAEVPMTYDFKDMYVITSCIANYLDHMDQGQYMREGKLITTEEMKEYSSEHEIESPEDLGKLLRNLKII